MSAFFLVPPHFSSFLLWRRFRRGPDGLEDLPGKADQGVRHRMRHRRNTPGIPGLVFCIVNTLTMIAPISLLNVVRLAGAYKDVRPRQANDRAAAKEA